MRFLVTGGAGFIGSHLCEYLLESGHTILAIDDLSTGRYENIQHLEDHVRFQIIIDTVMNRSVVEELIKSVDVVFHLASAVGVRLIIEQPVKTIETIVEGTNVILSQARRYRKKVLITSSSEVYGKGSRVPFSEEHDTVLGPTSTRRWAYAAAKGLDEFLAFAHWYETRLPVVCVRLFNTVGPRQTGQYGMVIPRFVQQAVSGGEITVYGEGDQTRCFCHVKDVVWALANIVQCQGAIGKVINVGNDEEISMIRLAERVKEITSSPSPIIHIPYENAYAEGFEDMVRRVPDLTLIRQLIGFQPRFSLDDILRDVIEHFSRPSTKVGTPNNQKPWKKKKPKCVFPGKRLNP